MNGLILDIALLFFIEIIEANLQRGRSFNELVNGLYVLYKQKPIGFLLLHTSLFYVLFYAVASENYSGWFLLIVAAKGADLLLKLQLFRRIEKAGQAFSAERFFDTPDVGLSPWLRYSGALIYTAFFTAGVF